MAQQAALQAKQPDGTTKPENDPTTNPPPPDPKKQVAVVTSPGGTDGAGDVHAAADMPGGHILSARLVLGAAVLGVSETTRRWGTRSRSLPRSPAR